VYVLPGRGRRPRVPRKEGGEEWGSSARGQVAGDSGGERRGGGGGKEAGESSARGQVGGALRGEGGGNSYIG